MSYNTHQRAALDPSRPLAHRASHARSCVSHVANQLGITRETVMLQIQQQTGVDLQAPETAEDLNKAVLALAEMRTK